MDKDKKILVVDDDTVMLKVLETLLFEYTVLTAADGLLALGVLEKNPDIKLLITDINMPNMNGIELISNITKLSYNLNIVVLTAFGSPIIKQMPQNGFSYLDKPFDSANLFQMVKDDITADIKHVKLSDIIKLTCITKKSAILKTPEKEGSLYIKNGELIHAEYENMTGEKAFNGLFGLEGNNYEILTFNEPVMESMTKHFEHYVFQAMKALEE